MGPCDARENWRPECSNCGRLNKNCSCHTRSNRIPALEPMRLDIQKWFRKCMEYMQAYRGVKSGGVDVHLYKSHRCVFGNV